MTGAPPPGLLEMCEEETASEPSSPPVESTKEHDEGGATTLISDSDSSITQRKFPIALTSASSQFLETFLVSWEL